MAELLDVHPLIWPPYVVIGGMLGMVAARMLWDAQNGREDRVIATTAIVVFCTSWLLWPIYLTAWVLSWLVDELFTIYVERRDD